MSSPTAKMIEVLREVFIPILVAARGTCHADTFDQSMTSRCAGGIIGKRMEFFGVPSGKWYTEDVKRISDYYSCRLFLAEHDLYSVRHLLEDEYNRGNTDHLPGKVKEFLLTHDGGIDRGHGGLEAKIAQFCYLAEIDYFSTIMSEEEAAAKILAEEERKVRQDSDPVVVHIKGRIASSEQSRAEVEAALELVEHEVARLRNIIAGHKMDETQLNTALDAMVQTIK